MIDLGDKEFTYQVESIFIKSRFQKSFLLRLIHDISLPRYGYLLYTTK